MPAWPITRCFGKPLASWASAVISSSGLDTTMITALGECLATFSATPRTILALVSIRSIRLMPGLRGKPGRDDHDVAVSSLLVAGAGGGVGGDTDDLGLEALDRPRLVHVERQALGLAVDDVGEDNGVEDVVLGEALCSGRAVETRSDHGHLPAATSWRHERLHRSLLLRFLDASEATGRVERALQRWSARLPRPNIVSEVDRAPANGQQAGAIAGQHQSQRAAEDDGDPQHDRPDAEVVERQDDETKRPDRAAPAPAATGRSSVRSVVGRRSGCPRRRGELRQARQPRPSARSRSRLHLCALDDVRRATWRASSDRYRPASEPDGRRPQRPRARHRRRAPGRCG